MNLSPPAVIRLCDKNCHFECPDFINDLARKKIFEKFLEIDDLRLRQKFLAKHIMRCYSESESAIRQKHRERELYWQERHYYEEDDQAYKHRYRSRRHNNGFFLPNGCFMRRVCRTFFMKTFDINEKIIRTVLRSKIIENRSFIRKETAKYNPHCSKKCYRNCSGNVHPHTRETLFRKYLTLANEDAQIDFLAKHIEKFKPYYQNMAQSSKKRLNYAFYFIVFNRKVRVCKDFFKNSYNITNKTIENVIRKKRQKSKVTTFSEV